MEYKTGFLPADILIPKEIDLTKWSVVACDQYTSQPAYWDAVAKQVEGVASSYNITFPEIYLNGSDKPSRINAINQAMRQYEQDGIFECYPQSFVYVERILDGNRIRRGLVGVIDLMEYDYHVGSDSKIRATEKTVMERIPARVQIRENALLEIPHVMLLIDDETKSVIEPVAKMKSDENLLYDFELMQGGGRIRGYLIAGEEQEKIEAALLKLADPEVFSKKYEVTGRNALVFAVGDGNHSLASAKECFEREKQGKPEGDWKNLKSRYALVELVNIHDPSLKFEPIHRVVFDCELMDMVQQFKLYYKDAVEKNVPGKSITLLQGETCVDLYVPSQLKRLTVAVLQEFLDSYVQKNKNTIDYIHGNDVVKNLSMGGNNVGILLPEMGKSELFQTVILDGALPRKTFSMGSANEKRFYLESRKIK